MDRTKQDGQDVKTMTIFKLTSHVNGDFETVTATQRGGQILVELPGGASLARNIRQATKMAADALGPALERAGRSNSAWGLHVSAGGAAATFGKFPEGPGFPERIGRPARPSEPVSRIFNEWEHHDGTPLGALHAAIKIIEIYVERRPETVAA